MNHRDVNAASEAAWRTTTVLLVSLPIGVTLLVLIGLWLRAQDVATADGGENTALVWVWIFVTASAVVAALVLWQRLVRPHLPVAGARGEAVSADDAAQLQTGLVTCMALIEGAALFGGVLLIIGAGSLPALIGVVIIWTAFFLLRPRRAWYGLR